MVATAIPRPHPTEGAIHSPPSPAPSFPLVNAHPAIHAITAEDLAALHQKFVATPLPSKAMFPWLHGVDGTSSQQNYFFGLDNPRARPSPLPLPDHRGLLFVHANEHDLGRLVGSVAPSEILQPAPTSTPSSPLPGASSTFASLNPNHDNNLHPQIHHQYSTLSSSPSGGVPNSNNSDWADISDSASSSVSSSLSSTTSNNINIRTPNSNPATLSSFMHSLSDGINIRNFKVQVPRYALISDIVVYAKEGESDMILLQVAKQISAAQEEVWQLAKEHHPQYQDIDSKRQTFILADSFAMLEAKYPELVAVGSNGKAGQNKVDFWEQEREQMSFLTRASEIAPGVWLGNNSDVPLAPTAASSLPTPVSPGSSLSSYFFKAAIIPSTNTSKSSAIPSTPPPEDAYPPLTPPSFNDHSTFHPSVCIECRSGANAPTTITLDRIKNNVASSPAPLAIKEIFHLECLGTLTSNVNPDVFPPSTSSLSNFARPGQVNTALTHSSRRSTAAGLVRGRQMTHAMLQTQITNMINMAFFIQSIITASSGSDTPSDINAHQVLIHCVDGYTETTLLGLAFVMLHYRLSLAEAYVKLQTDLGRSFFVYPNDSIMMLEVESQLWERMLLEKSEMESLARYRATTAGARTSSPSSPSSLSSSSSSSFFSSLLSATQQQQQPNAASSLSTSMLMEGIEPMPDRDEELASQRPFTKPGHEEDFHWFYHPEFEGSFPSRILPFLYLGNLAHASNPGLLKSLGIRYVLSVGEEASGLCDKEGEQSCAKGNSSKFMVKLVDDMYDNGVDSLWSHLENCVEFVDEARRTNSRILIHCRVGVSRSATIVIAYLMAHYNLSLVDAYLMVRARRLSVIIQPNLLFMYELLQWEQRLRGRFDSLGWPGIAREIHSLNMYYIGN